MDKLFLQRSNRGWLQSSFMLLVHYVITRVRSCVEHKCVQQFNSLSNGRWMPWGNEACFLICDALSERWAHYSISCCCYCHVNVHFCKCSRAGAEILQRGLCSHPKRAVKWEVFGHMQYVKHNVFMTVSIQWVGRVGVCVTKIFLSQESSRSNG